MGEAKLRGAAPLSTASDRALVTKADMQSVQVWCDQVREDVREMIGDADERTTTNLAALQVTVMDAVQTLRNTVDEYRRDELLYRNNVSVRGRLRRLKWWLLATLLPFGGAACYGGETVKGTQVTRYIDSAYHVGCYQLSNGAVSCVRLDSVQAWRASDSTWILR